MRTWKVGNQTTRLIYFHANPTFLRRLLAALPFLVNAIVQHCGQTCSAGSRLLIQRSIYDQVVSMVAERFKALRCGSWDQDLEAGCITSERQLKRIKGFLDKAVEEKLDIVAQGTVSPDAPKAGFYQPPTIIGKVPTTSTLFKDEIFGPVLVCSIFDTEEEALKLANSTEYGLVSSIWTRDGQRMMRMARKVRAGQIYLNNYGAGGGVELPFGGFKRSGYGREKGFEALDGFTVTKTVAIYHG